MGPQLNRGTFFLLSCFPSFLLTGDGRRFRDGIDCSLPGPGIGVEKAGNCNETQRWRKTCSSKSPLGSVDTRSLMHRVVCPSQNTGRVRASFRARTEAWLGPEVEDEALQDEATSGISGPQSNSGEWRAVSAAPIYAHMAAPRSIFADRELGQILTVPAMVRLCLHRVPDTVTSREDERKGWLAIINCAW